MLQVMLCLEARVNSCPCLRQRQSSWWSRWLQACFHLLMSVHAGVLALLCDLLAWRLPTISTEPTITNIGYVHALMYTSCARSRASRASRADKYSASGLLMAVTEARQGLAVRLLVLPIS